MTVHEWAEERARELLNRLDSSQFKFTAEKFEDRVKDRKVALDIIAAALIEAEARGEVRGADKRVEVAGLTEVIAEARAEGERSGREKGLEEARAHLVEIMELEAARKLVHYARALRGKP